MPDNVPLDWAATLASRIGSTGSATLPPTVSPPSSAPAQKLPENLRQNTDLDDVFGEPLIKEDDRSTWKRGPTAPPPTAEPLPPGNTLPPLTAAIEALIAAMRTKADTGGRLSKNVDVREKQFRARATDQIAKDAEKARIKAERDKAKAEKDRARADAKAEREKGKAEKKSEASQRKAEKEQARTESRAERERAKKAREDEKERLRPPDEYDTKAGILKDSIFSALPQGGLINRVRGVVEKTHSQISRMRNIDKPKGSTPQKSFWSRFKKTPKSPASASAPPSTTGKVAGTAAKTGSKATAAGGTEAAGAGAGAGAATAAGGAEGAGVAAAGAEAVAGPVGWAVLFATAVAEFGKVAYDVARAAYDFAKGRETEIRKGAEVGPQQAVSIARLDAERVGRDIKTASETGDSSQGLTEAMSKFEDAIRPIESLLADIQNTVGKNLLTVLTEMVRAAEPLTKALRGLYEFFVGPASHDDPTTTWERIRGLDADAEARRAGRWPGAPGGGLP